MLRVAKVIPRTTAEGPHERCAIWVAGCDLACPGCCNPELFDPSAGRPLDATALAGILDAAKHEGVEGITVLGGEPLAQLGGLAMLLEQASARGLGTLVFTGYTLEAARERAGFEQVWAHIDTLVDGPFAARHPETHRRFIGSTNQRLQHRTARYAEASLWRGPTRIEVRVDAEGAVELHGMPKPVSRLARALGRAPD